MGNAQKALVMAAGIFLALALITTAVILFVSAQDATKTAQTNFTGLQTELSQTQFTVYDNTVVSGSQVVNAIRKYSSQQQFGIQIITGKDPSGSWYGDTVDITDPQGSSSYGSVTGAATGSLANSTNEASVDYVNPTGQFQSQLIKDSNNVVRGIKFVQQQ